MELTVLAVDFGRQKGAKFELCQLSFIFVPLFPKQRPTHPVYNISPDKVVQAAMYFLKKAVPNREEETADN